MQETGRLAKRGISGSTLKWIALCSMLIDHLGASGVISVISDAAWAYDLCRQVGRLAFPLYCFLLTEGFIHTHDRKRYLGRLFLFALLSEIPFDLAFFGSIFYPQAQNVFFTLFLGLLTLEGMERAVQAGHDRQCLIPAVLGAAAAWGFRTDYSYVGILLIALFYWFRGMDWKRNLTVGCCLLWEPAAILALLPIQLYNGRRGASLKYFFYVFYPVHLLILWCLRELS